MNTFNNPQEVVEFFVAQGHDRAKMEKLFLRNKDSKEADNVNHPSHYTWLKDVCGVEAINICEHLGFNLGNAAKYILRAGHKHEEGMTDNEKRVQDLKKAAWYINREINNLTNEE